MEQVMFQSPLENQAEESGGESDFSLGFCSLFDPPIIKPTGSLGLSCRSRWLQTWILFHHTVPSIVS